MTRLTLLTEIPAPYRIPLFNALADRLDLTVLFLRERNPDRPYGLHEDELRFERRVLRGFDSTIAGRWLVVNRGATRALRASRPEAVVIGGWNQPAFWAAGAWARRRRIPLVLWVESTGRDRRSGRLEAVKRALLGAADAFIVPGRASREYLRSLGVPAARITTAHNAVDPTLFATSAPRRGGGRPVVLAVGRLAHEKGIDVLLRATADLAVDVVVAGTGPEEERLRLLAGSNVRFLGHVDRDGLPALYARADVLAMPSRSDPWGMVLNEASLAGLPIVSTDAAGAAHDLIEDGSNGFRVPPDDVEALREALRRVCEDEALRTAAGVRSRELGSTFTPAAWAEATANLATTLARR